MIERFVSEIKVRGYHADAYGHVNNARYLEFLEEARWDYGDRYFNLKELQKRGLLLVLVNVNINYRLPSFPNETIKVETFVEKIGEKSVSISQNIYKKISNSIDSNKNLDSDSSEKYPPKKNDNSVLPNEPLISDANLTFVVVDSKTGKSVTLDSTIKELLGFK